MGWDWTRLSGEEHLCSTAILVILPGVFSTSVQCGSPVYLGDVLPCTCMQDLGSQQRRISRGEPAGGIQWCVLVGWHGWEMFPGDKTQTVAADTPVLYKTELGVEVCYVLPILHPGGGGFLWGSCWSICISAE